MIFFVAFFLCNQLLSQVTPVHLVVDWMGTNQVTQSETTVNECSDLKVTLVTPNGHKKFQGTAYRNTASTTAGSGPLTYTVKFNFSEPVSNVKLKLSDIDRQPRLNNSTIATSGQGEKLINFTPSLPNITGGFEINGNEINALADDSEGWLSWNGTSITSISFDVVRFTNQYGIIIEELKFDCTEDVIPPPSDFCCKDILVELQNLRKELKEIQKILKENKN